MNEPLAAPGTRQRALSSGFQTLIVVTLGMASLCLGLGQVVLPGGPRAFLTKNELLLPSRLLLLGSSWLAAVLVAVGVLVLAHKSRDPAAARRDAVRFFAPFSVCALWPLLFVRQAWEGREFAHLVYVFALGLATERLLRPLSRVLARAPSVGKLRSYLERPLSSRIVAWLCRAAVFGLVAYYFVRIGQLANVSHYRMQTQSSDLAEYDNLFFNALHGHPFRAPGVAAQMENWSNLANHAELSLYLLLPFYALSPGAHALLWIQTGLVALTAVPLYLIAARRLGRPAGVVIALAFLCMPAVQQPNFYDFHFTPAAMFFVAWLLFFLQTLDKQPGARWARVLMYVSTLCALSAREDIGIGIVVLGVFLVLGRRLVREGFSLIGIGGLYFVSMKFLIMPRFGSWWFDAMYEQLKTEGVKGFGSIVVTLLSNQAFVIGKLMTEPKALYLLHMTAPVLGLWLRRPLLLMAVLPGFVATLLVTDRPPLFQASFQYTYLWLAYVVGASILAIRRTRKWSTLLPIVLVALSLDVQKGLLLGGDRILGGFGTKTFEISEGDRKRHEQLAEIMKLVPRHASLAVTEAEGPHVSTRLVMFSLKYSLGHSPDYLLVGHSGIRGEQHHIREALESGQYGVIATKGPYTLVKRGAPTKKNGPLLRRVGGRARP